MSVVIHIEGVQLEVQAQPLTRHAFAPFGDVINNPRPDLFPSPSVASMLRHGRSTNRFRSNSAGSQYGNTHVNVTTTSIHSSHSANNNNHSRPSSSSSRTMVTTGNVPFDAVPANQDTAIKFQNVSRLRNLYPGNAPSGVPAQPQLNVFSCVTRALARAPFGRAEEEEDDSSDDDDDDDDDDDNKSERRRRRRHRLFPRLRRTHEKHHDVHEHQTHLGRLGHRIAHGLHHDDADGKHHHHPRLPHLHHHHDEKRPDPKQQQQSRPPVRASKPPGAFFNLEVMERHPFTTQTFFPLSVTLPPSGTSQGAAVVPRPPPSNYPPPKDDAHHHHHHHVPRPHIHLWERETSRERGSVVVAGGNSNNSNNNSLSARGPPPPPAVRREDMRYLVIVAPSVEPSAVDRHLPVPSRERYPGHPGRGLPDIGLIRAFIATGEQAVTYAAGTWHAPMVALGPVPGASMAFGVVQFANGISREDCQEVQFAAEGSGEDDEMMQAGGGGGSAAGEWDRTSGRHEQQQQRPPPTRGSSSRPTSSSSSSPQKTGIAVLVPDELVVPRSVQVRRRDVIRARL